MKFWENLKNRRPFISGREHRAILILILLLEAVVNGGYTIYATILGEGPTLKDIPAEIAIYVTACALWYLMYRAVALTFGGNGIVQALVTVVATILAASAFAYAIDQIRWWFGLISSPFNDLRYYTLTLIWVSPMFVIWALVLIILAYGLEVRERERQLAYAHQLAQGAQLQALRYQINPHFLYNTLNSISALILDEKNKLAEEMVLRLANFFRASLTTNAMHDVPLGDEIQLQRMYLDIEKIRFEDRLQTQFDLPPRLANALVPSFILQPLIENVIKYGIGKPGTTTCVRITARDTDERLTIEVRDDGQSHSDTSQGSGVGLRNVQARLAARFNNDYEFVAGPLPAGGYCVRMTMPLLFRA